MKLYTISSIFVFLFTFIKPSCSSYLDKNIDEIYFPGTYHSGSYQLYDEFSSHVSLNKSEELTILAEEFSPHNPLQYLLKKYQKQYNNVYDQLHNGIRYIEFDISYQNNQLWRLDYILLGNPFSQVLYDIKKFIMDNPNEIVLVNIRHPFGDLSNSYQLSSLIIEKLGQYMFPRLKNSKTIKYKDIVNSGRNIIICMPYGYEKYSHLYWHFDFFQKINYVSFLYLKNSDFKAGVILTEHANKTKLVEICTKKNGGGEKNRKKKIKYGLIIFPTFGFESFFNSFIFTNVNKIYTNFTKQSYSLQ